MFDLCTLIVQNVRKFVQETVKVCILNWMYWYWRKKRVKFMGGVFAHSLCEIDCFVNLNDNFCYFKRENTKIFKTKNSKFWLTFIDFRSTKERNRWNLLFKFGKLKFIWIGCSTWKLSLESFALETTLTSSKFCINWGSTLHTITVSWKHFKHSSFMVQWEEKNVPNCDQNEAVPNESEIFRKFRNWISPNVWKSSIQYKKCISFIRILSGFGIGRCVPFVWSQFQWVRRLCLFDFLCNK